MENLTLSEIIIRGRYIFKNSPKLLETFRAIDGKLPSEDIARILHRNVNAINRDIRSLKNIGLIYEIKKVGNRLIYDKIPLAKEISQKDFETGLFIPNIANPVILEKKASHDFKIKIKIPDQYEILEIAKVGENQLYEFKKAGTDTRKIIKEIAAFANSSRGD